MEIWFYHLTRQRLEQALPTLLERSLQRGWRVVIQGVDEERLVALDEWLWTCSSDSFLAHGMARDGDAQMQPIYLTTGSESPNGAQIRFFIDGADVADVIDLPDAAYERFVLMFDGADPERLQAARGQWKRLKDQDRNMSYYQQSENGGWEKKA